MDADDIIGAFFFALILAALTYAILSMFGVW